MCACCFFFHEGLKLRRSSPRTGEITYSTRARAFGRLCSLPRATAYSRVGVCLPANVMVLTTAFLPSPCPAPVFVVAVLRASTLQDRARRVVNPSHIPTYNDTARGLGDSVLYVLPRYRTPSQHLQDIYRDAGIPPPPKRVARPTRASDKS